MERPDVPGEKSPRPLGLWGRTPTGKNANITSGRIPQKETHTQNFCLILHLASSQFYSQVLVGPFGNLESRVEAREIILGPWKSIFGMELPHRPETCALSESRQLPPPVPFSMTHTTLMRPPKSWDTASATAAGLSGKCMCAASQEAGGLLLNEQQALSTKLEPSISWIRAHKATADRWALRCSYHRGQSASGNSSPEPSNHRTVCSRRSAFKPPPN